jgi:site-specific DNA-adenine methylase
MAFASKTYGIPYMGSKSQIAPWVISKLPRADVFVDLFAGGCAITHAALLSGKYKRFVVNDITDAPKLFCDAIAGKYRDEKRWISREDFFRLKDTDPYIRLCWSFGNNQKGYLYSEKIEPYKKALHYALYFNDASLLRSLGIVLPQNLVDMAISPTKYQRMKDVVKKQFNHRLELQANEALERLQALERLERLQAFYADVPIPNNAVVYCDPPYRGTQGYGGSFDFEKFDNWLRTASQPIFVSEYSMPKDFKRIAATNKKAIFSQAKDCNRKDVIESIYVHEKWYAKVKNTQTQ